MSLSEIFRSVSLTLKKKKQSFKKRFYEAHERVRNTAEEAKRDSGSFLFLFSLSVSALSVLRHPPKSPRFRRCFSLACPPCTPLLSLRTQLFVCLPSAVETQELQHLKKTAGENWPLGDVNVAVAWPLDDRSSTFAETELESSSIVYFLQFIDNDI